MGLKDWRARRAIKDPVRGEFRPSGSYFPHPDRVPIQEMLIGVVTAPGIEPTAGEALNDLQHPHDVSAFGASVLPALVDRADPARFVVLWQEAGLQGDQAEARSQAQQAAAPVTDEGAADPSAPAPEVHADDGISGGPAADLAKHMADQMRANGISGMGEVLARALSGYPFTIDGPAPVTDPAAGQRPAEEAVSLATAGEPATAVLTDVVDVPVPQAALPGPAASLCDLTLQVHRADGRSYTARTRLEFPDAERRAAVAVIGRELPVRVDTRDETRVAVDDAAFDVQHPRD
jgi:hypothetical protein